MKQIVKKRTCLHCNVELELPSNLFSSHVRWCNKRSGSSDTTNMRNSIKSGYDNKLGKLVLHKVNCFKCSKEFEVTERSKQFPVKEKYFCTRSCANSRVTTDLINLKRSKKAKDNWNNLSIEQQRLRLEKSTNNIRSRSTGERKFLSELQKLLPDDNWNFSIVRKFENKYYSLDLVSEKLKIFIEYDGIWHFEDIRGQLKRVQEKDKLVEEYILKSKYKLRRISEDYYNKYGINDLIESLVKEDKIFKLYLG